MYEYWLTRLMRFPDESVIPSVLIWNSTMIATRLKRIPN